jgi:hypothetical protein
VLAGTQDAGQIDRDRLRPPDRNSDVGDSGAPPAGAVLHLERRWRERSSSLVGSNVVARECVIGPSGQQQYGRAPARRDLEGEVVRRCVPTQPIERKVVRRTAVYARNQIGHIATLVVNGTRDALVGNREQPERLWWLCHALVWIDLDPRRMGNRQELHAIGEHRLFELVGDANLVRAVDRPKLVAAYTHVLDRVRGVAPPRGLPVAHFPGAQEVGHELEPLAVPCKEERTGRRLPIELLNHDRVRRRRRIRLNGFGLQGA